MRFIKVGCDLAHCLRGANTDRAGDAQLIDALLDLTSDLHGVGPVHARRAHIEERLIDAHLLQVGRIALQYVHDLLRYFCIACMAACGPNGVGAQTCRGARGHGGMHAVFARFVGGGRDHAALGGVAPYDDGLAAPLGVIVLFNGSEERIEVHKQDRRSAPFLQISRICR